MASSRDRQRKLARAKVERQMARRAARARRRRQIQAGLVVVLVVVLAGVGTAWAMGAFEGGKKKVSTTATCAWTPLDTKSDPNIKDVGAPPTSGEKRAGTETFTMTTDKGVVTASLDAARAPCAVANMAFLAGRQFFNNTVCDKLSTNGPFALSCGDPGKSGKGGPAYTFGTEYTPTAAAPAPTPSPSAASASVSASASASPGATPAVANVVYPRGTLAMASDGGPDHNGSRFFIVYKDSPLPPNYTAFGTVTRGLDVIDKIAAAGAVDGGKAAATGAPKTAVTVQSLVVTPDTGSPSPSGSAAATPTTSGSPAPSAKS